MTVEEADPVVMVVCTAGSASSKADCIADRQMMPVGGREWAARGPGRNHCASGPSEDFFGEGLGRACAH